MSAEERVGRLDGNIQGEDFEALVQEVGPTCAEQLAELTEYVEKLSSSSLPYGEVVFCENGNATLITNGQYQQVANQHDLSIGESVLRHPMTGQVVEKLALPKLGAVVQVLDYVEGQLEVVLPGGASALVHNATGQVPNVGSKVVLSKEAVSAVYLLPEPERKKMDITPVTWDMIGGQEEAKEEIREAIEYPHKHKRIWSHYNKRIPRGILLWGPPGCGKTMVGKALAHSIGVNFVYLKGPEILDPYVGVSESNLRKALKQAAAGALLFLDEADAILRSRDGKGHHTLVEQTIVPTFLSEIDGIEDFRGTVVLATNRPDVLDPAVMRDGRMDRKIEVKRPGLKEVVRIFDIYLSRVPTEEDLSERAAEMMWDDDLKLPNGQPFRSLSSGALVEGIVDKATSNAIRRDMESKKLSRITGDDLLHGTMASFRQNRHAVAEK